MTSDPRTSPEPAEIRVSLQVSGFREDPSRISEILGLEPTEVRYAGDPLPVPGTVLREKSHRWILRANAASSTSMQVQLEWLLARTAGAAARFHDPPGDASIRILCVVYDYERSVPLIFSATAIARVAALGAGLDIDYYDLTDYSDDDSHPHER